MTWRKNLWVLMALVLAADCILLPVKSNYSRCLMEYSTTAEKGSIKVRIDLPTLLNGHPGDHYSVTIRNTETEEVESDTVKPATKYIKEFDVVSSVLYEVCVHLKTDRPTEAMVEYKSESSYWSVHEDVKVPESLLKREDLKGTFTGAERIEEAIEWYNGEQERRKRESTIDFFETDRLHDKLTVLSGIECVVVIAVGVYQFFAIKNYLENRQYV